MITYTVSTSESSQVDGAPASGGNSAPAAHNHDGTYEPADATILKDADIGVSVEAYNSHITKDNVAETITENWDFTGVIDFTTRARIKGTSTGTPEAWLQFSDSANTQMGYVGFGSGSNNDLIILNSETDGDISFFTNGATRMTISAAGAATFTSTITATNFIDSSDRKLKKNIASFDTDAFMKIKPVQYKLKDDDCKIHYGVIAQDLQTVLPEAVTEGAEGMLGVSYKDLFMLTLKKVQEHERALERLKNMSMWTLLKMKLFR
jgi:hypothetical protein